MVARKKAPAKVKEKPSDGEVRESFSRMLSFVPVSVGEPVDFLPKSASASIPDEVTDAIIAAGGKFVPVDGGGRKLSSTRALVKNALVEKGYTSVARKIDETLYIAILI